MRTPRGGGIRRVLTEKHSALAKSLITATMQDGVRGTSSRCGGGFAKQVAGNVEKGEAPTLLRERFEIRLDENLRRSLHWHESRHEPACRQIQPRGVARFLLELWRGALGLAFGDQWWRLGEAVVKWTIEGCLEPLHIDQSRLAVGTR
jgi:hypothetical protein